MSENADVRSSRASQSIEWIMRIVYRSDLVPANVSLNSGLCSQVLLIKNRQTFEVATSCRRPTETIHAPSNTVSREDAIAFIEPQLATVFAQFSTPLLDELAQSEASLFLLVPRRSPPSESRRYDGEVLSFICTGSLWLSFAAQVNILPNTSLCYQLLTEILGGSVSAKVLVRQLPGYLGSPLATWEPCPEIAVITPHRHPRNYLQTSLASVAHMNWPSKVRSYIGLDVDDLTPYQQMKSLKDVRLFRSDYSPLGPYVYRQALIERSEEELLLFQDSDDIACVDRATILYQVMLDTKADMVGSHELEVNQIDRTVRAYRFPLDVSAVLDNPETEGVSPTGKESFLHATAMIKRTAFCAAGGFSTNRRIANDSQFLLRASFSMTIANADAFLYVRRTHPDALTAAPETRLGSSLRMELSRLWGADFQRVKRGELALENSSLIATPSEVGHRVSQL